MLHIKLDLDWSTALRDIIVSKCERRLTTEVRRQTTDDGQRTKLYAQVS